MIFCHLVYQLSYPPHETAAGFYGTSLRLSSAAREAGAWCGAYSSVLEKRSRPNADSTISRGIAPTTAFGCSPGSKKAMVGMLEIPNRPASDDSASTSTLATFTEPS